MGVHVFPNPEPPSHLPPHTIPLGHPSASAPSILYHASNLDWRFISHMILHIFQCYSLKSSHPLPLPQSPKDFYISVSLLLSHIQGYCYHVSKFHIYAFVYCISVVKHFFVCLAGPLLILVCSGYFNKTTIDWVAKTANNSFSWFWRLERQRRRC